MAGQNHANYGVFRYSNKASEWIPFQIFVDTFPGVIKVIEAHVPA